MKKWILFIAFCLVSLHYGTGHAGDISLGKAKSANCVKCHGIQGISEDPAIPNLAGQRYSYLFNQLIEFMDGLHRHSKMTETLSHLSHDELDGLATYYASLKPPSGTEGDSAMAAKGKLKYTVCQTCHGTNGEGQGSDPRLAGQHSTYIITQLKAFKNGSRQHPVMALFVDNLTEDDLNSLAQYISGFK